jgi:hypothetical protein
MACCSKVPERCYYRQLHILVLCTFWLSPFSLFPFVKHSSCFPVDKTACYPTLIWRRLLRFCTRTTILIGSGIQGLPWLAQAVTGRLLLAVARVWSQSTGCGIGGTQNSRVQVLFGHFSSVTVIPLMFHICSSFRGRYSASLRGRL